jgi:hypothetical protein
MQCRVGGANKIRHNEYATVWANTLDLAGYDPVALEVPVPHPPGPPGLPEPDVPLRTDVTARGIFEPQGTTHFDVKFVDCGGEYIFERMTTQAERDKGTVDLTKVFSSSEEGEELCANDGNIDGIIPPPVSKRKAKAKGRPSKKQLITNNGTSRSSHVVLNSGSSNSTRDNRGY